MVYGIVDMARLAFRFGVALGFIIVFIGPIIILIGAACRAAWNAYVAKVGKKAERSEAGMGK